MELGQAPVWRELDRDARRVLVTDGVTSGQGRSALAAVRAAAAGGYEPVAGVSGDRRRSLVASSRATSSIVDLPPAGESGYAAAVRRVSASGHLTVLPASDAALLALGAPVAHLVDKQRLHDAARAVGVLTPATHVVAEGQDPTGLPLPAVVKSAVKSGSADVPVRLVTTTDELRAAAAHGPVVVQPVVTGAVTAVAGVVVDGAFRAVVHQRYERTWPIEAGTACSAVTVAGDGDAETALLRLLEGYEGIVQAQYVGGLLVDVNPRVYGSLPLAVAAGANLVAVWCDALRGVDAPPQRGRAGVAYRWIEGDARHLLEAVRAGDLRATAALRALSPRTGSAHSVVTRGDLGPLVARLRHAAARKEG